MFIYFRDWWRPWREIEFEVEYAEHGIQLAQFLCIQITIMIDKLQHYIKFYHYKLAISSIDIELQLILVRHIVLMDSNINSFFNRYDIV